MLGGAHKGRLLLEQVAERLHDVPIPVAVDPSFPVCCWVRAAGRGAGAGNSEVSALLLYKDTVSVLVKLCAAGSRV